MKKIIAILTISLLFTMNITGCTIGGGNKIIPKDNVGNSADTGIRDQSLWQEYENSRFGYSIRFPKAWYKGNSSQNNDGIALHIDESDFDIRVYGANYIDGTSKPYSNLDKEGFKKEDIKLNQGETATLITGEEDNMSVYEMVFVSNNFEYHFYAKVSNEYATEYEDVIIDVIKTFNVSLQGEEKEPTVTDNTNNDKTNTNSNIDNNINDKDNSLEEIIKDKQQKVIGAISELDMGKLAEYVHPEKGVRFTP